MFLAIVVSFLALTLALLAFVSDPGRRQNQRLALLLLLEGAVWLGTLSLAPLVPTAGLRLASVHLTRVAAAAIPFAYLLLIATLPTRRVALLRDRLVNLLLWAGLLGVVLLGYVRDEWFTARTWGPSGLVATNGPLADSARLATAATAVVGLIVAVLVWREAPPGSMTRRQGRLYAVAFGTRDAGLLFYVGLLYAARAFPTLPVPREVVHVYDLALTFSLFCLLLTYAILRVQLFDIDLRIKALLPKGFVAATVLGGAAGIVSVAARALPGAIGYVVLAAALAVLFLLVRPLHRGAVQVAAWLMPDVRASREYLVARREEVYRAALEATLQQPASGITGEQDIHRLRASLGISQARHAELLAVAQSQLILTKSSRPTSTRFRVLRELGRGSAGRTFLAQDTQENRRVVLKQPLMPALVDPRTREAFLREARLLASLNHPNIVRLEDVFVSNGFPVMVLSYEAGGDLEHRLARGTPLPREEALAMADDVLAGLDHMHQRGLVHRDLKPANILFDAGGHGKLTDFGIALDSFGPAATLTMAATQGQPGSTRFMSPEQARGARVDARTDLYALAAVLHLAITGHDYLEFEGQGDFEIRRRIQEDTPALRLGAKEGFTGLRSVLEKALSKDARARYQNAAKMRRALRRVRTASASAPVLARIPLRAVRIDGPERTYDISQG